jgi:5'-nucleotidase/UDP-sugar diphosphatase
MFQFLTTRIFSIVLLFIAILFMNGCSAAAAGPSHKAVQTTIIHMNDIHSHLDEEKMELSFNGEETQVVAGGYPRVAMKIKAIAGSSDYPLLLNAGDALEGTLYYTLFGGDADAAMMNTVAWDAFVLGNHEFDNGDQQLADFLTEIDVPVIAANVLPETDDILHGKWAPYRIRMIDGEPVGIIGIVVKKATEASSRPSSKIAFADEIETTQKYVDLLASRGINKIILLSHYGYANDVDLAARVEGVDLIIGGHSHTLMGDFSDLGLDVDVPYPVRKTSKSGDPVCIAQAWAYAKIVGRLDVAFSKEGIITSCSGTPVLVIGDAFKRKDAKGRYREVNATERSKILEVIAKSDTVEIVKKESRVEAVLDRYKVQVDQKKQDVIGYAKTDLRHIRIPGHDYLGNNGSDLPLGSEIAPVVARAFFERIPLSDACILNAGAVRTNVNAGKITIDTVYTLLPFANTLFTLKMKGSEIAQVLEDALFYYHDDGGSTGSFPYAYGLRYDVDMTVPLNRRIKNLQIKKRKNGAWSDISDDTLYTVVTIDYLASGKDGYTAFKTLQDKRGKGNDTFLDYAMAFVDYVKVLQAKGKEVEKLPVSDYCIRSYTE